MASQIVYYNGITFTFGSSNTKPKQDSDDTGYHIPADLYAAITVGDIQSAVDYVLKRRAAYQNHPEAGVNQCLAVIVAIYDRLGAENAFRFYKGQRNRHLCCANILEALTDIVIALWPSISQGTRVDLLSALLDDVSIKSWSTPDDVRIDTGYKIEDRPPNTKLALTYHPVEMLIVHDMIEKLRNQTELAHYQHELGSLESTPEWATDFAMIELDTLPGVLRSVLRRDKQYKSYADWRRGTGFRWKVYAKPKDDLTNWGVLKKQEYKYDYFKEVLTRSHDRDEENIKAEKQSMNYYRYMALLEDLSLHELDKKYIVGSINKTQRDELFEIMAGIRDESHYDMAPLKEDYDDMQRHLRVAGITKSILHLLSG